MVRTLMLVSILLNCGLPLSVSQAQLFRGPLAPPVPPPRVGLLGGLREARDERFRREEQAAIAAARAAAAQRNAAANPGMAANNNLLRTPTPNATPSLNPNQRSLDAARSGTNGRTANYGSSNLQPADRIPTNSSAANPKNSSGTSSLRAGSVVPAGASVLVPEPVNYDGPGVAIRLPKEAPAIVNYLVDDVETIAIRPGEQQVLDSKGSYIVRFSRGVTADGRSFGESRYTITEGRYRFELTATGWELYRESDSDTNRAPLNRLDIAGNRVLEPQSNDLLVPEPSPQSELQRTRATDPLATEVPRLTPRKPSTSEPVPSEEVLPAPKPRSILE